MCSGTVASSRCTYSYVHFFEGSMRKMAAWHPWYTSTIVASSGNVCLPSAVSSTLCASVSDSDIARFDALSMTSQTSSMMLSSGLDRACH